MKRQGVFALACYLLTLASASPAAAQRIRFSPTNLDEDYVSGDYLAARPAAHSTQSHLRLAQVECDGWDPYVGTSTTAPVYIDPLPPATSYAPQQPWYPQPATSRCQLFGEFLYLQPGDGASTAFAIPATGGVPIGPIAALDPEHEPGFRAGIGFFTNEISLWSGTYTFYESSASEAVSTAVPVLSSLVLHPATITPLTTFTEATAQSDVNMHLIDVEYRRFLIDNFFRANYVLGARFANLDQTFDATFVNPVTPASFTASTDIDFQGAGVRIGLEGEWHAQMSGFLVYSKGFASLLAGRFESSYTQTDNLAGIVLVSTSLEEDRIVPILDLEVGVGWRSQEDRWRISAGYLFSGWFNFVTHEEFIGTVQRNEFEAVSDTLTFDGLVARAEVRF